MCVCYRNLRKAMIVKSTNGEGRRSARRFLHPLRHSRALVNKLPPSGSHVDLSMNQSDNIADDLSDASSFLTLLHAELQVVQIPCGHNPSELELVPKIVDLSDMNIPRNGQKWSNA